MSEFPDGRSPSLATVRHKYRSMKGVMALGSSDIKGFILRRGIPRNACVQTDSILATFREMGELGFIPRHCNQIADCDCWVFYLRSND
jgi:hypothetical protein